MIAATRSARKPARVPCPQCAYTAEPGASIAGHVAMAHSEGDRATYVGRRPEDELACIGSNHVPGCEHLRAPAVVPSSAGAQLAEIPLDLVDVGANVRVDIAELEELTASIAEHGVLQPVKAFPSPDGRYRLVWGQRRVLAARAAGLTTIPAIVEPAGDVAEAGPERSIEQLVENLHRADLNPIDRATAMRAVVDSGISQADLARKLGIAPSTVSNDLRLLTLAEPVRERIHAGEITASHGKAIAALPAKHQAELASRIVSSRLSAHQIESQLAWRRQAAESDARAAERARTALPKLLAALEAAGIAPGTALRLMVPFNMDVDALRSALVKAGYTLSEKYVDDRPPAGKCDCAAATVTFTRSWKIAPGCIDDRHRDRQRNLDHQAEEARRTAIAAKVEDLTARIRLSLDAAAAANLLPVPVLALIAAGGRYGIAELLAGAGDPDRAQLRQEAAKRLAGYADPTRAWGDGRAMAERALEDLIALLPEVPA